jgi:L-threonylcarbamoyladenylate synthase
MTRILTPVAADLSQAATLLRQGGLVAFPTETVYGLGGDACSDGAAAAIYAAKGRPSFNPLIVHVSDAAMARRFATFDALADRLAAAFWPGPLTLVLPLAAGHGLAAAVTAGLETVAVRVPAHPVAQALLAAFGGPLAAPSANPSGRVSPTRAAHVVDGLGGRISAVVDGGACVVGVESTIVGVADGEVSLLRPGGLAVEDIEVVLGKPLILMTDPARPMAPGQLASHYAPQARVRLDVTVPDPGEVWIGFGTGGDLSLSPGGDLAQAAASLFHVLREADRMAGPGGRIAVAPVPATGLGRAINDRLRRAAAPR